MNSNKVTPHSVMQLSRESNSAHSESVIHEVVSDVNAWRHSTAGYEALCKDFALSVPTYFNMAEATVGRHARSQHSHRVALICDEDGSSQPLSLSYGELYSQSLRMAAFLRRQGVQAGDVVVCYAPQGRAAALTHLGCYLLGAVVAPLSLLYGKDTLKHAIADSRARFLVTTRAAWDTLPGIRSDLPTLTTVMVSAGARADEVALEDFMAQPELAQVYRTRADDPALLLYTSGSTGMPKGILHAHRLVLGYLASVSLFYQLQMREPGQVLWTPSDWSWIAGIVNVQMTGWYFGHTVVAGQAKVTAEWIFEFSQRHGVTHTFLTPTALKRMASIVEPRQRWPQLRLRAIGTGGEPCPGAVLDWSRDVLGVPINEFYGLTEVNHLIGNCQALYPVRAGSMGKAYPGHRICVLDDEGNPVPAGVSGQVAAHRSDPTLFLEYWNQPQRTQAMFHGDWVLTGDYAKIDESGYFWYEGRQDDLIKSAGYRIGPAEVEEALVAHSAVEEAAVIGVPDPDRGQVVKAYIRLAPGHAPSEHLAEQLRVHVKTNLAVYKYPRLIEFVQEFPLTSTGKISRKHLRSQAQGA